MSTSNTQNSDHKKQYQGILAEGRRVKVFWEDDNIWYEGVVYRYSPSKDKYMVHYDDGGKEWEQMQVMDFIVPKQPTTIKTSTGQQPRRSARMGTRTKVLRSAHVDSAHVDSGDDGDAAGGAGGAGGGDVDEDESEDELISSSSRPYSRPSSRGGAAKKGSNGTKAYESDDSGETKPRKSNRAAKRKVDSEDVEMVDQWDSDHEIKLKKPKAQPKKSSKKKAESESDYEEVPVVATRRSTRGKKVESEEDEEEDEVIELDDLSDEDDEEDDEEDEDSGLEDEEDEDEEEEEEEGGEEAEEGASSEEEFKEVKKRGRGKPVPKGRQKPKTKAPRQPRGRAPAREVPTEGVQLILAARRLNEPSTTTTTTTTTSTSKASSNSASIVEEAETTTTTSNVEMLVKYRGKSYRAVEWVTGDQLLEAYPAAKIRVRRVLTSDPLPNETPNPDYSVIDRIVDKQVQKGKGKGIKYLVKWKSLPYEECTWEREDDLQSDADLEKVNGYNEMEAIALKRSNKPRKTVKYVKNMDPPPFLGDRQLRDFQKEGFLWLTFCWHQKRSSLLADEMGLGKTIQTISLLEYLRTAQGIPGPFLVIAPLSTIENWQREVTDWTGMRTLVLHGVKTSRDIIRKHEWMWPNGTYKFDTLVTSYEIAIAESALLSSTQWKVLVVDEAHRIKNQTSKLLSKLNTIKRDHCVMLTGTPLQNDMKELWSLLNFLDPDSFGSKDDFLGLYGDLKDSEQVQKLHEQLGPFILRRHKESVDATIPVKEETVLEVELSTVQKTYYRAIMDKNREFLGRGLSTKNNLPKLNNIMMQIRKVCNHPFLIPGVEDRLATEKKLEPGCIQLLVNSCSKLMLVDKLLTKLREGGHKVLMFSQMVELLDILEEYLILKDYPYERLDGGVKSSERQAGIDRFNDPTQDSFVYLLSTRAGGVGINLTAADTVIIYDSDWNPQNDLQAQARCHRIGQTENVKVYRLLSRNTYEQYMFQVSSRKLALGQVVLLGKNGEYDGESDELDKRHVDKLLKYGAYELFKEDLSEAATKEKHMQEEDIDSILERATTITYDNMEPKDALGNGFNKATFLMGDNDNEIGIDDADFWQKILPEYKDLEYFRERMASGVAVASDESRAKFMEELTVYTNDRKEKPPQGVLLPSDLLNLFLKIENSSKFNQDQRNQAKYLRETLETPRRRTAAQVSRDKTKRHARAVGTEEDKDEDDQYTDENEGDSSGSEEDEERPNKRRRTAVVGPNGAPSWNKARRERLKWALLRFGFGRWDKSALVARVSPEEAQVFTENCVCKLLKSPVAPAALASHLVTLNDQYELYMIKTSNAAKKALPAGPTHAYDLTNKIDVTLENAPQDPSYVFTPGDKIQFKLVVSAGTINLDEAPDLRLIAMYGSELVRCYSIKNGTVSILVPGFIGAYEWKCVRPGSKNLIECGSSVTMQVGCHPMFFEENFDSAPRAPWVKKLNALYNLNEIGEELGPTFATLSLPNVPAPPLPQWGKEQDRLLLMGVYKHGYGKFQEILADDEIGLGATIDNWVEGTTAPDLKHPSIPMLNKRLYKVLEVAKKQRDGAKLDFERRERRRALAPQEGGFHHGAPVGGVQGAPHGTAQGAPQDTAAEEKDKDFILLTARIRFLNKELITRMRDDDVFSSLSKPVLKQLNQLGYCREKEGKLVFAYKGYQITQPQTTTPRKLNIVENFHLSLTWVLDSFKVEVVWLDKTVSLVHVRKHMRMTDILCVKYSEPYNHLRLQYNGITLPPDYTIEEANLSESCVLSVVRYMEKLRLTVAGPDRPNQHFKVSRSEPFSAFMEHYAKVINTTVDQLSFTLNGRRLNGQRTPDELGVTERDVVSISVETVLLVVRNEADNTVEKYTIHTKTNLKHLMSKYVARQAEKGNHNKITFTYSGKELADGCTVSSMGIPNNASIVASWERDQTVVVTLHDYKTGTTEEYRVGVDVVLRDLVDAFCNDNSLPCSTTTPPRVTAHSKPVNLNETMKELGIQDRDIVHVVRDPPAYPSIKPTLPPPRSDALVYTIDD